MDDMAEMEITRMLSMFPQTTDPDLTMETFDLATKDLSAAAIIETAQRFVLGVIEGQSVDFAPTVSRFAQEARKREEYSKLKVKELPVYRHHTGSPFYVRQEKVRNKYRDCAILAQNIGLAEYQTRIREFPPGHALICAVATVFGPPAMEIAQKA